MKSKQIKYKTKIIVLLGASSFAFAATFVRDLYTDYQALKQFHDKVDNAIAFLKPSKDSKVDDTCKKLPLNFLELQLKAIDAIKFSKDDPNSDRKKSLLAYQMAKRAQDYNNHINSEIFDGDGKATEHGEHTADGGKSFINGTSAIRAGANAGAEVPVYYQIKRGDVSNYAALRDPKLDGRIDKKDFLEVVKYFKWDGPDVYKNSTLLALNIGNKDEESGGFSNTLHAAELNKGDTDNVSGVSGFFNSLYEAEEVDPTADPSGPEVKAREEKKTNVTDKVFAQLNSEVNYLKSISVKPELIANYCGAELIYRKEEISKDDGDGVEKKSAPYLAIAKVVAKNASKLTLKSAEDYSELKDKQKENYKKSLSNLISHCPALAEKLFATHNTLNKLNTFLGKEKEAKDSSSTPPEFLDSDDKSLPCFEAFLARIKSK